MSVPVHETAAESARARPSGESLHRYPPRAVLLDYLYSMGGLLFTLGPLAGAALGGPAAWFFAALAALFAVYGARTVLRHRTRLRMSADGLAVEGLVGRRLAWERLTRCRLGYYATRRNRDGGWMQLTLGFGRGSLRIDSQIQGFEAIARRAAHAAAGRGIALDRTTRENLRALGIAGAEDPT